MSSVLDPVHAVEVAIDTLEANGRWSETDDGEALLAAFDAEHMVSGRRFPPRTVESKIEREHGDSSDLSATHRESLEEQYGDDYDDWERGLIGSATGYEFDGETTAIHAVFLYERERYADASTVRDHVESNRDINDRWATLEDYEIESNDRS